MIDIARNIVPCSDKQDMKSRNGSYFQPSFSTRKRQRISSDLFSELPQKRSKTTIGRIWNKATYFYSSQTLCTIFSKVIRMWASFIIFVIIPFFKPLHNSLEDVYGIRLIIKEVIIQTHSMEVLWIVIDNLKLLTIFSRVSVRLRFKRNHWQKLDRLSILPMK